MKTTSRSEVVVARQKYTCDHAPSVMPGSPLLGSWGPPCLRTHVASAVLPWLRCARLWSVTSSSTVLSTQLCTFFHGIRVISSSRLEPTQMALCCTYTRSSCVSVRRQRKHHLHLDLPQDDGGPDSDMISTLLTFVYYCCRLTRGFSGNADLVSRSNV